ncbi:ribonuclease HI family protein [Halobacillus sp. Marseille-Q1614]|uniref:ribonuclease HI family protein n=1 Tax=Halobacillus sp. Marseille-Q1614 TaxID=2709134 RepID=UPI001570863C|nr:ribonuclease HI family protein [Halobacillus sp. Marseille-Q1614]
MIEVYTDAAAAGNPGPCAAGIIIKNGRSSEEHAVFLGEMTNHEAEFLAVLHALKICKDIYPGEILSIRSDSQAAVHALDKQYSKNPAFAPILNQIIEMQASFAMVFYKWIPDKTNKNADRVARAELKRNQQP